MTERHHVNQQTGEVNDDPHIRPFADFLRDLRGGATHEELSEALWDLTAAVRDTGKKGALQLTIYVEPTKGDTTVLTTLDEINPKLPKPTRRPSMFFTDHEGNLSRTNPNQPEISGLREVAGRNADDLKEAR